VLNAFFADIPSREEMAWRKSHSGERHKEIRIMDEKSMVHITHGY
jgi:hypothetical protein